MIDKPGIYADIPSADYFADPCPAPSLTQSIAKVLLESSPAHARIEHPRLSEPEGEDDEPEKYVAAQAIGNAAHAVLIGRGKDVVVAPFENWKKKDGQDFRDDVIASGRVVILPKHNERAVAMVKAARAQLSVHEARDAFTAGQGEVVLAWEEEGIWFRSLVDWLHDDLRCVDDFKTTGLFVHERLIPRMIDTAGWDLQAAMQERGLDALDPAGAGRRKFRFVAQENWKPYALNVVEMTEAHMTMGRKKLDMAIAAWRACMERGVWPGYPSRVIRPEVDGFREGEWLKREIHEAATKRSGDYLMAG